MAVNEAVNIQADGAPTLLGEGGKKIAQFMVDEYAKLAK